jgi:molecular chaperone DnaK
MVKDAEKNAADDKKRREEIDARNRLDSLTYEVEKNAKEWSDRLSTDLKTRLESAVERARKAHRGEDMGEVKAAMEELSAAYQEAGRSLYSQQQGAGAEGAPQGEPADASAGSTEGAAAGAREGAKQDDVVEADYEIVDETKKN